MRLNIGAPILLSIGRAGTVFNQGARMNTLSKVTDSITAAKTELAAGFTTKAQQSSALEKLNKARDLIKNAYHSAYLAMDYAERQSSEARVDFYYSFPSVHNWKAKHTAIANELYPELADLPPLMDQMAELRRAMKDAPIVKAPSKAQQAAAKVQEFAKSGNLEILSSALQSVLDDVTAKYVEYANSDIASIKAALLANDMDITKAFDREDKEQVSIALAITEPTSNQQNKVRTFSPEKEAAYVEKYKASAKFSFDKFIAKMVLKLGDKSIATAKMSGTIWMYGLVIIQCTDGSTVKMKTTIILNRSKFGKLFNQWPTRIVR